MARITSTFGVFVDPVPDGGGTFSPLNEQPMPNREGNLCLFATEETAVCQEGPREEGPVPETATGSAGVEDTTLAREWTTANIDE